MRLPREPERLHGGEGDQHRERDGRGDDEPAANAAKQQEQHRDDEERALGEVFCDRVDGAVHEVERS
jgi:hypothetical protein